MNILVCLAFYLLAITSTCKARVLQWKPYQYGKQGKDISSLINYVLNNNYIIYNYLVFSTQNISVLFILWAIFKF